MKKQFLVFSILAILAISILATTAMAKPEKSLKQITKENKDEFKDMLKSYLRPQIHGWGIGYDCAGDTQISVKFQMTDIKILPRSQIINTIKDARASGDKDWSDVREEIKNALAANGTEIIKGRISINGVKYLLMNVTTSDTNASADIKQLPDYAACKQQNLSAEQCESNVAKIGDMTITRRVQTELPGEPRLWGGTLNFNSTAYKLVAIVYPRS
ncbi:MAG: hypothetical protein HZB67_02010 [Candidatus Aenigmarchaeota archaeon]|nr:hypothetical protein [Candidatus Aenigmarchaeota archaeon]